MYRIEITEITQREARVGQVYQKVADTGNPHDTGAKYDWIDSPNKQLVNVERKVLTQEVETVDLPAVIKAINNL